MNRQGRLIVALALGGVLAGCSGGGGDDGGYGGGSNPPPPTVSLTARR